MDSEAYRQEYNSYIEELSSTLDVLKEPLTKICAEFSKLEADATNIFSLKVIDETMVYIQTYLDVLDSTKKHFQLSKLAEDGAIDEVHLDKCRTQFNSQKLNLRNHSIILLPIAKNALGVASNITLLQNILKIDPLNESIKGLDLLPPRFREYIQSARQGYAEHIKTLSRMDQILAPMQASYSNFNEFLNTLNI